MKFTYTFDQLRDNEAGIIARFMNYEWIEKNGGVDLENYFTADSGTIDADTPQEACEKLYRIYNVARPVGYEGRSMSVSDIVNLWDNNLEPAVKTSWFCDSFGFIQLSNRDRLFAEWIDFRKSFRLYRPNKPQETVAYVDNLKEVDTEKYCVMLCD